MEKLKLLEFFVRGLPESFLFIFAAYAFSKTKFHLTKYLLSSVILALVGFITRSLPINYGVHNILNIFAFILLIYNINKIDLIKSIKTGIISAILQFVCELINIFIIQYIFKQEISYVFSNPTLKTLYGIPSLLIFGIIVALYYIMTMKEIKTKQVSNGKIM